MQKKLIAARLFLGLATSFLGVAHAGGWFPGSTGQYHLIPDGQDVQNLTLIVSAEQGTCPGGRPLLAVDEFGTADKSPFVVPSETVFIVTDAWFNGHTNAAFAGATPMLNITSNVPLTYPRASFQANRPLQGLPNEDYQGAGSLQTGGAFAVGSTLCASINWWPSPLGLGGPNVQLGSVVVHGKLIDNSRSLGFTW